VDQEIARELASLPTQSTSNVPELPELFTSSDLLQKAFERTSTSAIPVPEDGIQLQRYNVAFPADGASEAEWETALNTASSTLEHQYLRTANAELLNKFGANSWRISNFLLEKDVDRLTKEAEEVTQRIEDINRGRKQSQVGFPGPFLWVEINLCGRPTRGSNSPA
jgi:pre-mRNA-splicing factor SPF27